MNNLSALKLVAAKKPVVKSPVAHRRNKLCSKIDEQISMAQAHVAGEVYTATRIKTTTNENGERIKLTQPKRVKPWWFATDDGKLCIEIRYGARVIELTKGKSAVEIAGPDELVQTLETVKRAVLAGELDQQIEAVSKKLREGFKG